MGSVETNASSNNLGRWRSEYLSAPAFDDYYVAQRFFLQFAVGLALAITAALMMYCQERCFVGVDLEFWPVVLGILGIGIVATSSLHRKK